MTTHEAHHFDESGQLHRDPITQETGRRADAIAEALFRHVAHRDPGSERQALEWLEDSHLVPPSTLGMRSLLLLLFLPLLLCPGVPAAPRLLTLLVVVTLIGGAFLTDGPRRRRLARRTLARSEFRTWRREDDLSTPPLPGEPTFPCRWVALDGGKPKLINGVHLTRDYPVVAAADELWVLTIPSHGPGMPYWMEIGLVRRTDGKPELLLPGWRTMVPVRHDD